MPAVFGIGAEGASFDGRKDRDGLAMPPQPRQHGAIGVAVGVGERLHGGRAGKAGRRPRRTVHAGGASRCSSSAMVSGAGGIEQGDRPAGVVRRPARRQQPEE